VHATPVTSVGAVSVVDIDREGSVDVVLCVVQARLHTLQTDPTTYTTEPSPADSYREWLSSFDVESSKGRISELLVSNVEVRALYTQLVSLTESVNSTFDCTVPNIHVQMANP